MSAEILLILVIALLLDRVLGDPDWLWSRLTHPVVFFGKAVEYVDEALNRGEFTKAWLKFRGVVGILVLLAGATALGVVLARLSMCLAPSALCSRLSRWPSSSPRRALQITFPGSPPACDAMDLLAAARRYR